MSDAYSTLMADVVARHFAEAQLDGAAVNVGFGDLSIECRVDGVRPMGEHHVAALYFRLRGGRLGEQPIFASMNGYAVTPEHAIVEGACMWTCSFGPVLRAALARTDEPEVARFDVGPRHVIVDKLDRVMRLEPGAPDLAHCDDARARFGGDPWLCRRLLESGTLPPLPPDRVSIISVFIMDGPGMRAIEVKVNGKDHAPAPTLFASVASGPTGVLVLLRELAAVAR